METFSALLAICAGNSPVPGDFPTQRPVTRSFDVFFDLRLNKRLSTQSWGWWLETLSCSLWRQSNGLRRHGAGCRSDVMIVLSRLHLQPLHHTYVLLLAICCRDWEVFHYTWELLKWVSWHLIFTNSSYILQLQCSLCEKTSSNF